MFQKCNKPLTIILCDVDVCVYRKSVMCACLMRMTICLKSDLIPVLRRVRAPGHQQIHLFRVQQQRPRRVSTEVSTPACKDRHNCSGTPLRRHRRSLSSGVHWAATAASGHQPSSTTHLTSQKHTDESGADRGEFTHEGAPNTPLKNI